MCTGLQDKEPRTHFIDVAGQNGINPVSVQLSSCMLWRLKYPELDVGASLHWQLVLLWALGAALSIGALLGI